MKILIAPDKFKDALDAAHAAAVMATGVRAARPDAEVAVCPLADGGEGTGELLAGALRAEQHGLVVLDPLGRPRVAHWWRLAAQRLGIVEIAQACGLAWLAPRERDALRTTSFGAGQLLRAALDAGCERILLAVGGTATVDGGAGCLQALGWVFADAWGESFGAAITGQALADIHALSRPAAPATAIDILCDVDNPLLGTRGAAAVFGPQKGANEEAVRALEHGLESWANLLDRQCGCDVRALPGGGAAGGLPAGLAAALGARLVPGFELVAQHVRLAEQLADCDLCLTGEGCVDDQSTGGKVVAGVARFARRLGVPTVALTGAVRLRAGQTEADLAASLSVERIVVITPSDTPLGEALAATPDNLRRGAAAIVRSRT